MSRTDPVADPIAVGERSAARPALRIGIICNPRSHRNRRAEVAAHVPPRDVVLAAPRTRGELSATLVEFAARGIDLLVIDGGDGTVRDVLTAAADAFGDAVPRIAVLPTGKTNALALDLGIPVDWTLDTLLTAAQTGGIRRRSPIAVARAGSTAPALRGFLFGAGGFVQATELAQRTHTIGAFHGVAVGLALVGSVLQTAFGRADSEWRRGTAMRIEVDGTILADRPLYLLFASTLQRLPTGVRPLGAPRPGLKTLIVDAPPRWMGAGVPALLAGKRGGWLERIGYRHRDLAALALTLEGNFILDGEMYPGGALTLTEADPIEFVVP